MLAFVVGEFSRGVLHVAGEIQTRHFSCRWSTSRTGCGLRRHTDVVVDTACGQACCGFCDVAEISPVCMWKCGQCLVCRSRWLVSLVAHFLQGLAVSVVAFVDALVDQAVMQVSQ